MLHRGNWLSFQSVAGGTHISDGTGPENGLENIGGGGSYNVGQTDLYFGVVGVANKPAGTYNLVLQCNSNFAESVTVRMGTLMVWAAK